MLDCRVLNKPQCPLKKNVILVIKMRLFCVKKIQICKEIFLFIFQEQTRSINNMIYISYCTFFSKLNYLNSYSHRYFKYRDIELKHRPKGTRRLISVPVYQPF